ncbi:unnamed protein product [Lampetra planeri]
MVMNGDGAAVKELERVREDINRGDGAIQTGTRGGSFDRLSRRTIVGRGDDLEKPPPSSSGLTTADHDDDADALLRALMKDHCLKRRLLR